MVAGGHGCWGACVVAGGGVRGCQGEHAWLPGECAWLLGGVRGCWGGMHGERGRGHVWNTTRYGNTINERAVRILLE